ncbi:hypothetical protein L3X38_013495 [Prunus dulcis]|uniref:Uncharacterized protein n=1 Tax=Prunus dulcis TaxID=3755 RepID=A0AAD4WLB7_PRUDU|nr:hypothetical protein L3X38_013495 [Prunus dulcis]
MLSGGPKEIYRRDMVPERIEISDEDDQSSDASYEIQAKNDCLLSSQKCFTRDLTFISLLSIGVNQFHVLHDNDDHEIRGRLRMLGLGFGDQIWDDDDCRLVVNLKLEDGKEQKPISSPTPNRISQN